MYMVMNGSFHCEGRGGIQEETAGEGLASGRGGACRQETQGNALGTLNSLNRYIVVVFRIRIRMQVGKMAYKNREKIKKFHVLKCWMFSFEG